MTRSKLALPVLALVAACAPEQEPINRVQNDKFDKSFFLGADYQGTQDDPEFYAQNTLVDVGYGAGQQGLFTSTYAQPLTRVKWSVTENLLIARLAYERIQNSDGRGAGKATNDGIVVAAYPILRHFDVRRAFNPQTGEQLNIFEEDSIDRRWHERQYIRVDWSKNLSTDNYEFDTLSQLGIYGGISYSNFAIDNLTPGDPNAPHIDEANGYLDVTYQVFAKPLMVDLSSLGGGTFPACYFNADISGGQGPYTQCSSVELTLRQSFRKVVDNDYEPADWDGVRFRSFGAFTTERSGYTREWGMTDATWHRFINRYNLWERSHAYADPAAMTGATVCYTPEKTPIGADPHRDLNGNGTEDECEDVGAGSRCDAFSQKCTLPYRQRVAKPVVWYYAEGSNPDYFEGTREAAHQWDVAMRTAVVAARYAECTRTGSENCRANYPMYTGQQVENDDAMALAQEVDDCRAGRAYVGQDCNTVAQTVGAARGYSAGVIFIAQQPELVVLCHSPVESGDPAVCGESRLPPGLASATCATTSVESEKSFCAQALQVRKGDLRYHQVNVVTPPQTPSPWGIMVDAHDPLTGEKVSASINVWSHVTDLWSRTVVDTARYIKGELASSDITEGTHIRDWAAASEAANAKGALPMLEGDERLQKLAELAGSDVVVSREQLESFKQTPMYALAKHHAHELQQVKADVLAPSTKRPTYEARRKRALDTPTEAALMTQAFQSLSKGNGLPNAVQLELSSPLRGANPAQRRDIELQREVMLADRGACVMNEAPAPMAIASLASILEEKFGKFDVQQSKNEQQARAEKMRRYVASRAHMSVMSHEMGHSIALRHNFVSSSDAFNYRPQYWQLRTGNGANTTACTTLDPSGACVGPRYFDPITPNEQAQLLPMFMQSSTMEYAGEATQDFLGLGSYDFAATRMFYGDVVDVAAAADTKAGSSKGLGMTEHLDSFGGIIGISHVIGRPTAADPEATDTIHYSQLQKEYNLITDCAAVDPQAFKPASWNQALNGDFHPLLDGLIVKVNNQFTRCKEQPVDYVQWTSLRGAAERRGPAFDPQGRVRYPHAFATDRWADLGNLSVYRHDNGADPYELFNFLITQQEVNHIFEAYRAGKQTFSVRTAVNRVLQRYNEKLRDGAKGMGLLLNVYRDVARGGNLDFESLWPYVSNLFFAENMIASAMGFDHFARQLARPEAGPHTMQRVDNANVLISLNDAPGVQGRTSLTVPNGATGYFGNVGFGGKPLENALATDKGENNAEYTVNAGSYYEKAYTAMLMTESVDNFISDSRRDYVDARYRSVSLADLFPQGYRRWLANNLTGDVNLKGMRVATRNGQPIVDDKGFPAQGLGQLSWTGAQVTTCFSGENAQSCSATPPAESMVIDPQVGWEQQKFLIAYTLLYLPENQQQTWINQLGIWELGADTDPGFGNRIELHLPDGKTYIAKTFGTETVLGKKVQKGIAARVLEYANELVARAYVTDPGPDLDVDGRPDWVKPRLVNGQPQVKFDPTVQTVLPNGGGAVGRPGCNATDSSQCTCSSNSACIDLSRYEELPFFVRQAMRDYGLADPSMRGLH